MKSNKGSATYIFALTLVATLGGLLFGYDTAVISGATGALKSFFITPLYSDPALAAQVILEYKFIVSLCLVIVAVLLGSFLVKLYGSKKGGIYMAVLAIVAILIWYFRFWAQPNELTEGMANAINGFTISSALVGCIIGGSLGGYISQTLGRRNGMMLAAFLFTLSAIGSAIPDKMNFLGFELVSSFIFYRVVGGIGVGLASMIVPMYIAEIAPAGIRGKLVSWNQFAIIFGMLVVYFVNYAIASQGNDTWLDTIGWRWMFASETIPAGLFFFLLFIVPESPRYLVMADKDDKAEKVLNRLVGVSQSKSVLQDIKKTLVERKAPWLSFGGLVIIIGVFISIFQQFVGINVVLYYAPEIFRNMGSGTDTSLLQTIIVGAVNLTFTVVAILTVDKLGRKPLMIIGAVGMAFSMLALGLMFYIGNVGIAALIFMLLYTASFAVSWGPVAWVMLAEIFPNSIRGAMSIAVAAQWVANLIVSWTFPIMNDSTALTNAFHHGFAYWIYGIMGILAAVFMWKVVPETKGRTLEEMEGLWGRKHHSQPIGE
ncbi:D-xylose transporter XylE [Prolixibacter denitrificans]|uniref:D-xylose transporter XylE n=1 Tax=Prolixibacter denitrificans TaxID=1541063 RepID=A0A2P8CK88_9BACT|nr:D-xylose transporter XylE [Prolixibacter denitrificans]PSK85388.1 SP family xylose:H+ symportor-like MFS transporter [Prolixibacter denitrificans]GET20008.1 D-xylose transporter XylE [Prolixibacter denitrificans]